MTSKSKYYLELENGTRVPVTEEVFKEYWKLVNRENYLNKLDRKNRKISLEEAISKGTEFKNDVNIEKIVETTAKIDELKNALDSLSDEEREIIKRIYFDEESYASIAKSKNLAYQTIQKKNNRILRKLKNILKNFCF